ncbi:MAG: hypothetical protein GMKNLPBB_01579 [Myxococcota bacterium]|nr:hypothetical protein [Myxococcota bacterium]
MAVLLMPCPSCGHRNPRDVAVCAACESNLPWRIETATREQHERATNPVGDGPAAPQADGDYAVKELPFTDPGLAPETPVPNVTVPVYEAPGQAPAGNTAASIPVAESATAEPSIPVSLPGLSGPAAPAAGAGMEAQASAAPHEAAAVEPKPKLVWPLTGEIQCARWLTRGLAGLADGLLITLCGMILMNLTYVAFGLAGPDGDQSPAEVLAPHIDKINVVKLVELLAGPVILLTAMVLVYHAAFSFPGGTPGKLLFGLRVVTMRGHRGGVIRGLLRGTGWLLSLLSGGVGFLWVFLGKRGRNWSDLISGSYVVDLKTRRE